MQDERTATGSPAAERAVAGLCHDLNNRLASVAAYLFVLNRRGLLGNGGESVQADVDAIARDVRHIRALCRGGTVEYGPVPLSVVAEHASEIMEHFPEGPAEVVVADTSVESGHVVRGDWTQVLRAVLLATAWIRRGVDSETSVPITLSGSGAQEIRLECSQDLGEAPFEELTAQPGDAIEFATPTERAVHITLFHPGS